MKLDDSKKEVKEYTFEVEVRETTWRGPDGVVLQITREERQPPSLDYVLTKKWSVLELEVDSEMAEPKGWL